MFAVLQKLAVDVFGEMDGGILGHHDGRDVEQNHLNRIGEIDTL